MYREYWQLAEKPFEDAGDPRYYYPAEAHQAAVLKLRYAIENGRQAAVLAGPPGAGKTLVIGQLRHALGESFAPLIHVRFPLMNTAELLAYLAARLSGGQILQLPAGAHESLLHIEHALAANCQEGRHAVLALDEAHLVQDPHTLEALRLLTNLEVDGRTPMTLVLVGQTGLLPILQRATELYDRMAVQCLLRPFSSAETAAYVEHRLRAAGAAQTIFTDDALSALHSLTQGLPRRINRLAEMALLIGYAEGMPQIDAAQLEGIAAELAVPVAA